MSTRQKGEAPEHLALNHRGRPVQVHPRRIFDTVAPVAAMANNEGDIADALQRDIQRSRSSSRDSANRATIEELREMASGHAHAISNIHWEISDVKENMSNMTSTLGAMLSILNTLQAHNVRTATSPTTVHPTTAALSTTATNDITSSGPPCEATRHATPPIATGGPPMTPVTRGAERVRNRRTHHYEEPIDELSASQVFQVYGNPTPNESILGPPTIDIFAPWRSWPFLSPARRIFAIGSLSAATYKR